MENPPFVELVISPFRIGDFRLPCFIDGGWAMGKLCTLWRTHENTLTSNNIQHIFFFVRRSETKMNYGWNKKTVTSGAFRNFTWCSPSRNIEIYLRVLCFILAVQNAMQQLPGVTWRHQRFTLIPILCITWGSQFSVWKAIPNRTSTCCKICTGISCQSRSQPASTHLRIFKISLHAVHMCFNIVCTSPTARSRLFCVPSSTDARRARSREFAWRLSEIRDDQGVQPRWPWVTTWVVLNLTAWWFQMDFKLVWDAFLNHIFCGDDGVSYLWDWFSNSQSRQQNRQVMAGAHKASIFWETLAFWGVRSKHVFFLDK